MTEKAAQFTDKYGAGGLRTKPEVLARPVKDYKALVVAHDLFMAGWDTVVQGSWSLNSSRLLPLLHNTQTGDGNGKQAIKTQPVHLVASDLSYKSPSCTWTTGRTKKEKKKGLVLFS